MTKRKHEAEAPEPRNERPIPPDGWGYDWRGELVDLRGLRPGEDAGPPIYLSKKVKGEM